MGRIENVIRDFLQESGFEDPSDIIETLKKSRRHIRGQVVELLGNPSSDPESPVHWDENGLALSVQIAPGLNGWHQVQFKNPDIAGEIFQAASQVVYETGCLCSLGVDFLFEPSIEEGIYLPAQEDFTPGYVDSLVLTMGTSFHCAEGCQDSLDLILPDGDIVPRDL